MIVCMRLRLKILAIISGVQIFTRRMTAMVKWIEWQIQKRLKNAHIFLPSIVLTSGALTTALFNSGNSNFHYKSSNCSFLIYQIVFSN